MKQRILALLLFGLLGIAPALAQEREITGKVTDSKGEPLPGVVVLVVETQQGNATDIDGNFKVKASTGNTLRFTFINFKTTEVKVGAETIIPTVTLEDNNTLVEVIVTGYGDEKAANYVGSASVVRAESIERVPIANFTQALQGQMAGVLVSVGTGRPGAAGSILIRGAGSINSSTDPLIIVDGIPIDANDFASLNGNDFESITTLKDAASTSKYGSRGANGVIVIKTKKGSNGKTRLDYRFQQGVTTKTTTKFTNMSTEQRLDFERMLAETDLRNGLNQFGAVRTVPAWRTWINAGRPETGAAYDALQNVLNPLREINTDWQDVVFRTGTLQSHDLSATGGDTKTNFYVGGQYRREEGIVQNSSLDRYTLRANFQHNATDKLRIELNTSIGYSRTALIPVENLDFGLVSNPVFGAYAGLPYLTPESNSILGSPQNFFPAGANPAVGLNVVRGVQDNYKMVGGATVEYSLNKNITFRSTWGGDLSMFIRKSVVIPNPPGTPQNYYANAVRGTNGRMDRAQTLDNSFVGTNSVSYTNTFAEKHQVTGTAYYELVARNFNNFSYAGHNIDYRYPTTPAGIPAANASTIPFLGGSNTFNRLASIFADVNYVYNGKYSVSAGVRRDGSSRFGQNKRYGTFYNIGAAWSVSEESFMQNIAHIVDNVKLRASYGQQGNQGIADFGYLALFEARGNYNAVNAQVPRVPANPDIQWEQQASFNVGVDFTALKGRIKATVDFYNRLTTELFLDARLSFASGYSSLNRNVGAMRNRGIELNVTADVLKIGDFKWTVNVIHTTNRNKITDLGGASEYPLGTTIVKVDVPFGSQYRVKWAGVNPANGDPLYYDKDGNATTTYDANNSQIFGSYIAPHFGSFTNTFTYKGFDFSAFFVYEQGKALFNNQTFFNQNALNFASVLNMDERMLLAWSKPGDITDIPRLNAARQFSSRDIEDGSFMRLRNVTLGYTVPAKFIKNMKVRTLRAYVSGQNMLTFTKFTSFDPETDSNIQASQYPVPRTFIVGLDLGF